MGALAAAVSFVGSGGGALDSRDLALDGFGVGGDGSSGGVRDGGRLEWGGAKHYEVRGATGAAGVSGVDGVLDVGDEVAPGGGGEGDKAPAEEALDSAVQALHLTVTMAGVGGGTVVGNAVSGKELGGSTGELGAII